MRAPLAAASAIARWRHLARGWWLRGVASRSSPPSTANALSSELATLLPSPTYATATFSRSARSVMVCRSPSPGTGEQVGESVDHRDRGRRGEFFDERVVVRARHHPVHPARQVARHVGGRFARADAHLFRPQQDRVATELGHARLEGDVRAERRLLEVHRKRAPAQRLGRLAAPVAALQLVARARIPRRSSAFQSRARGSPSAHSSREQRAYAAIREDLEQHRVHDAPVDHVGARDAAVHRSGTTRDLGIIPP